MRTDRTEFRLLGDSVRRTWCSSISVNNLIGELTEQSLDCWETVLGGHGVQALVSTT